ncbi:rod shape-determining protein MreC [Candidatus Parcubacteria bacterium]|nr:rod shape-determining protein MreC [Candidatus Parcubacteria bacterium]
MSYLIKSSKPEPKRGIGLFITLGALLLIVGFSKFVVPNFGARVLAAVGVPLWTAEQHITPLAYIDALFSSKAALLQENDKLKQVLLDAKLRLDSLDILKKENDELKALMGRYEKHDIVLASVLVKPPQSPYDTFILDVGQVQGISVGDPIVVSENVFIGEVSEVFARSSKAKLFSTASHETSVIIERTKIPAVAVGKGGGNYSIKLPRQLEITKGDKVILPGLTTAILGSVEEIITGSTDSFQEILFKTPINLSALRFVGVIKSGHE